MQNKKNIPLIILYVINLLLCLFAVYTILTNKLFPCHWRLLYSVIIAIFLLLVLVYIVKKTNIKWLNLLLTILLIISIVVHSFFIIYVVKALDALETVADTSKVQQVEFSLVTGIDHEVDRMEILKDEKILAPTDQDGENIKKYEDELAEKEDVILSHEVVPNYIEGAQAVMADPERIMLLNETYRPLIEEQIEDFSEKTKVIDFGKLQVAHEELEADHVEEEKPFFVYISGNDTYGSINNVTLSDVNIIMSVNPNTHKILLTTIPRDSYVRIAGGGQNEYDKLTHAGIYGVKSSVETLEDLFDIDINYYARVNFTSLIDMVDIMGGITVENTRSFSTHGGKYYFPEGDITLNGEEALAFARERYALSEGDLDRGRNQMKVLKALLEKAMSPAILTNYHSILNVAMESSETNMPKEKMIELINGQLESGTKWEFIESDIKGKGTMGLPSHAMPGYQLYMFEIDDESLEETKDMMQDIMSDSE